MINSNSKKRCIVFLMSGILLFSACSSASAEGRIRERLKERFKQRLKDRSSGSETVLTENDREYNLEDQGYTRPYIVHKPTGFSSDKQYPLVLVLHGGRGNAKKIMRQTKFNELADQKNFVVVYPNAQGGQWSDGRGTMEAAKLGVDDVQFLKRLIEVVSKEYNIDQSKIFATGPSNGGMMSFRLGCEAPQIFAAVAPVIGAIPEPLSASCTPKTPVSLITINGTDDPLIPIGGGEGRPIQRGGAGVRVLSLEASVQKFVALNGCNPTPQSEFLPEIVNDGTSVEKLVYGSCQGGKRVISYVIHGGGHVWPPNKPQVEKIAGHSSENMNATQVIWDFFEQSF